jgi:subtilisin-like proprotein convertase family protein
MDNHSKKLLLWAAGGIIVLISQVAVFGEDYFSFGKSVNKYFGPEETKSRIYVDIFVPVSGIVRDIDIAINMKHTSFCDLQIFIGSPDLLGDTRCINSYDEYNFVPFRQINGWIVLDEESLFDIDQPQESYMGLFKPNAEDRLSLFYGQQSRGMWQIQIYDTIYADTGRVKDVRVDMLIDSESPAAFLIPEPATLLLTAAGAAFLLRSKRNT